MRSKIKTALALALFAPGVALAQMDPKVVEDTVASFAEDLGMTAIEVHDKGHNYGANIRGILPGGAAVEIEVDRHGVVEEIEARDRQGFPAGAIESLMPVEVTGAAAYPRDARFEKVELDGDFEIEGWDADGRKFDAEFTSDGRLIEMDYDD